MKLTELFPEALLVQMLAQEYVRVNVHPSEPLAIYNYTPAAAYDRVWNDVTLTCRGLIVNVETGEVVARPLAKFFTWGQPECPDLPLDAIVHVADKQDGSLGIIYPTRDGWAVATRGSFNSDQAVHATAVLRAKYPTFRGDRLHTPHTYLVEIVYPENRIVVNYGDTDELVLLGIVHIDSGDFTPAGGRLGTVASSEIDWDGPAAASLGIMRFGDALAMAPRPGMEGIVVQAVDGTMVKVKQADYVALHRIITNVTARTLWEFLAVNDVHDATMTPKQIAARLHMDVVRVEQILAVGPDWEAQYLSDQMPDEFYQWAQDTTRRLNASVVTTIGTLIERFEWVNTAADGDRKRFAQAVAKRDDRGFLFGLFNGQSIAADVWRLHCPGPEKPFAAREDVE